jgi:hypothetical protein
MLRVSIDALVDPAALSTCAKKITNGATEPHVRTGPAKKETPRSNVEPSNRTCSHARLRAYLGISGMNGNEGYWGGGISTISQNFPKFPVESSISQTSPKETEVGSREEGSRAWWRGWARGMVCVSARVLQRVNGTYSMSLLLGNILCTSY